MYNAIINYLGTPPAGTEPIVYIFSMITTLFLLNSVVSLFFTIFKGGK